MSIKKINKEFSENGCFTLKKILSISEKKRVEKNIIEFSNLFRKKIKCNFKKKEILDIEDLNKFLIYLEKYNKIYLWNFQQLVAYIPAIKEIQLKESIIKNISNVLRVNENHILIQDPLILINLPSTKRNLYSWHNAKNYYQKRNNYIGMWIPLIRDKTTNNGTMSILKKSHKYDYPFLEYQENPSSSHQNEIPNKYITNFKKANLKLKFGDVFGMDKNLIHSSTLNKTKMFSMVLVFKYWDISKDLTLSSNITQQYFKGDQCSGKDVDAI